MLCVFVFLPKGHQSCSDVISIWANLWMLSFSLQQVNIVSIPTRNLRQKPQIGTARIETKSWGQLFREVFGNRIFFPNFCFLRAFTWFTPGVEPNRTPSSQSTCVPLVRCLPVLFSTGIVRFCWYDVAPFGGKNQQKKSSYRSTFHLKMGPRFRNCTTAVSTILKTTSCQMASGVGCVSRNGWWDLTKCGPDSPVSRVKHACEVVETSIFTFWNRATFGSRWPEIPLWKFSRASQECASL